MKDRLAAKYVFCRLKAAVSWVLVLGLLKGETPKSILEMHLSDGFHLLPIVANFGICF